MKQTITNPADRKAMIQQGFDTVASGYTYKDVGVTGNAVCPWMDGSRTTHMYRTYGIRVTQDAVTEEQLSRSYCQ